MSMHVHSDREGLQIPRDREGEIMVMLRGHAQFASLPSPQTLAWHEQDLQLVEDKLESAMRHAGH